MTTKGTHRLLERQLRRLASNGGSIPPGMEEFIESVNRAYTSFDVDRGILERALELSSEDFSELSAQLRSIFSTIPDLYLWVDAQGTISEVKLCTQKHSPFSGRPPLLGNPLANLLSDETAVDFLSTLQKALSTMQIRGFEYTTRCGDSNLHFEIRIVPVVNRDTLVIFQDVTEKRKEDALRERQSKLDSIGILAGGIAHDFNNILTVISGNVSLSLLDVEEDSEEADVLTEIDQSVLRARQLTRQLLTFSKGGSPVRESASIEVLIRESVQFALRGSNVRSEILIEDALWPVLIDPGQINQVLNNLVINANQAMQKGGLLRVAASNVESSQSVKLLVQDQGHGIDPAQLGKIFAPYFTTKSEGNGLGLASSHAIISKHGGSISVTSTVGEGTTFEVLLPRAYEVPEEKAELVLSSKLGKGRVLLLDDDKPICNLASRMLRKLGYHCVVVHDGRKAVTLYQYAMRTGAAFHGLIMDLTIPGGMGGQEALSRIHDFDPNARAIASSGYSNAPVLSCYEEHGFIGILPKPYTIQQLSLAVAQLLPASLTAKS